MSLIQESFNRLFPDKEFTYQTRMEYNRRLSDFNANISLHKNTIRINLNLQWKDIDEEIKIGLIQHLLSRVFKEKRHTPNIDLYHNFTKNIHILTPKTKFDSQLESSFVRLNQLFFFNQLKSPNLQWGQASTRRLAHYNFHNDTITISTIFKEASQEVLDYVMYHELLHKHFKFSHKNGRSSYHSKEFREAERRYPNYKKKEREISQLIRTIKFKSKKKSFFSFFENSR